MIRRSCAILTFVLFAFAASSRAQVNSSAMRAPSNLNFEEGIAGKTPPGWATPTSGFAAQTLREDVELNPLVGHVESIELEEGFEEEHPAQKPRCWRRLRERRTPLRSAT